MKAEVWWKNFGPGSEVDASGTFRYSGLINGISYVIAALVFFCSGVAAGSQLIPAGFSTDTTIEVCKLFLGSSAVIIAVFALTTWRRQFFHNAAFRYSAELRIALRKLLIATIAHWLESRDLSKDRAREYDREKLPTFTEQMELYRIYTDAWYNMSIHSKVNLEKSTLEPEKLQKTLTSFFTPIDRDNIENYSPSRDGDGIYQCTALGVAGNKEIRGFCP